MEILLDSNQSSETKHFRQLLSYLLRSKGAEYSEQQICNFTQVTIKLNFWFPEQGTIDVYCWKCIGTNVNRAYENGGKTPVNYFASWSTVIYYLDPFRKEKERKKERVRARVSERARERENKKIRIFCWTYQGRLSGLCGCLGVLKHLSSRRQKAGLCCHGCPRAEFLFVFVCFTSQQDCMIQYRLINGSFMEKT